jgi:hypothetical protein
MLKKGLTLPPNIRYSDIVGRENSDVIPEDRGSSKKLEGSLKSGSGGFTNH